MNNKSFICSKMFTDLIVDFSSKEIKSCSKSTKFILNNSDQSENIFFNNDDYLSRRKTMVINNELPYHSCKKCIKNAPNSFFKYRNEYSNYFFSEEEKQDLIHIPRFKNFEFKLNNLCNLKCIYCNEYYSSEWAKELNKPNIAKRTYDKDFLQIFFNFLKTLNLNKTEECIRFIFTGGEPTINYEVKDIIEELIDIVNDRSNITIVIISNFNTKHNIFQSYLTLMNRYKNINFQFNCSIESLYEKAEAIRTNLKWERFIDNLEMVLQTKTIPIIQMASNSYAIPDLVDFFSFFTNMFKKYNKLSFNTFTINYVYSMEFSTRCLPKDLLFKDYERIINYTKINGLRNYSFYLKEATLLGSNISTFNTNKVKNHYYYLKANRPQYDWSAMFPHIELAIDRLEKENI